MYASSFDESNHVLGRPQDMSDEQCDPLSVWVGQADWWHPNPPLPVVISCFKMTLEELAEVNRTGRVWLVTVGQTMPPVILMGTKPLFE